MLTTAGAAWRTTGAKERPICSRDCGTCWATATAPGADAQAATIATTTIAPASWRNLAPREWRGLSVACRRPVAVPASLTRTRRRSGSSGSRRRLFLDPMLGRPGILPFGRDVAVDELDDRHRRVVAGTKACLEHAQIAACPVLVARAERVDQLGRGPGVASLGDQEPARVQIAPLAQGDQLLDQRPQLLGLGQRGLDLLVLDQRNGHVGEHRLAVARRAVQLAAVK